MPQYAPLSFFIGIESKIDYYKEIGVGTIWLSPIYESPMKDFGYDISNFTNIEPQFGTMDDFKSLSDALKAAGQHKKLFSFNNPAKIY